MIRFKMPKKATESRERYLAVVNYITELFPKGQWGTILTQNEKQKLTTAIKNLKKLAALAKKQELTDPELEGKSISLIDAFYWRDNCANGHKYWREINNIINKIRKK